jgi:glycine betaine/proline transport system permease protein
MRDRRPALELALLGVIVATLVAAQWLPWVARVPEAIVLPVADALNAAMVSFVGATRWFFRPIAAVSDWAVHGVRGGLQAMPWSVLFVLAVGASLVAAGPRVAVFAALALGYILVLGYWTPSLNSLALVALSVPLAVASGFGAGALAFTVPAARRAIMPLLDLFQAIPAFAYLIPLLLLFGFGPTVGLLASVLFAFPPMARNTLLGLSRVPGTVVEAGLMAGATPAQMFWTIRVPSARSQFLLGVNQATMASLSMVIVASIIGGTDDIGWEVLSTMRRAQFGESLLAGLVIVLMAMMLDRATAGLAEIGTRNRRTQRRGATLVVVGAVCVAMVPAAAVVPELWRWPAAWTVSLAPVINDALAWFLGNYAGVIAEIRTVSLFYVMLPVKIGLDDVVTPFTWGIALTPAVIAAFAAVAAGAASAIAWWRGPAAGAWAIVLAIVLYFGLVELPWIAMVALLATAGWRADGARGVAWVLVASGFLIVAGIWHPAMLSLYLCGLAVLIAFGLGSAIGAVAAHNDTVSALVRPVVDTLQTLPLFVILIPFVMIFRIGEFSALLAIVAYAIVPAIRYSEHALRAVPADVVEAARASGCSPLQNLAIVKLPLAAPGLMVGLNQTILFAIAMLVIAALIGTEGLGQLIYIGLSNGDFGVGMTAGLGMAAIAMLSDRLTQAWSRRRQVELGLAPGPQRAKVEARGEPVPA